MTIRTVFKRFSKNEQGATAVEFAVVSGVFFMMMMGIMEYGLFMMTSVALESAVTQGSRTSAITPGSAPDRATATEAAIRQKVSGLMNAGNITISATPISGSGAGTTAPDLCFLNGSSGTPTSPASCPTGTAYIDINGNGHYDGPGGVSVGTSGQLVEIRVNYPWKVFFPVFNQFFTSTDSQGHTVNGVVLITATTVVKNEPF